jgi:hypothetical protein
MISFIENTLSDNQISFEVAVFDPAAPLNLTELLWSNGTGNYRAYFMWALGVLNPAGRA